MGPIVPLFSRLFFIFTLSLGCIKIQKNNQKTYIPYITRETRHVLDFSSKKNIQQTEKPVVKIDL